MIETLNSGSITAGIDMQLNERIRMLLGQRGRSQNWLARQIEVKHNTFARWMALPTPPIPPNKLRKLAEVLGTDINTLLGIPPVEIPAEASIPDMMQSIRAYLDQIDRLLGGKK